MSADIEIAVEVRHQTDLAMRVFDGRHEVWLPKSMISDWCEEPDGTITSVFIPEWLAEEKELI